MPKYFVWLPSQTGPQPQIWHDDEPKNGEGKVKFEPLFKRLLDTSEADLGTMALAAKISGSQCDHMNIVPRYK